MKKTEFIKLSKETLWNHINVGNRYKITAYLFITFNKIPTRKNTHTIPMIPPASHDSATGENPKLAPFLALKG